MAKKKSQSEDEKIDFRYNLKIYLSFLKRYKILFIWLILVISATEALYVADSFLFKVIVDNGTNFAAGTLAKSAFFNIVVIVALVFIGVVIFRTIFKWLSSHMGTKLESKLMDDMKRRYFNHILDLSYNFHTTHKSGTLISKLSRGTGAVEEITDVISLNFAPLVVQIIIVGVSLAYFGLIPALAVLIIAVAFVSYSFYMQRLQEPYKLDLNQKQDSERGFIGNVFTNVSSIKYFGKEGPIKNRFKTLSGRTKDAWVTYLNFYRYFDAGQTFILGLGTLLILGEPVISFLNGGITLGTLVFVYTIYGNLIGPMFGFVWGVRGYYRAMADFQDLFFYGKIEKEVKDKENAKNLRIQKGGIEFRGVSFDYGKRKLFRDFNLKIKPNEKVALVGHSGCGKTTLVNLLYRLYDVKSGKILIDGKDTRDFKQESLRGELSIVPQECILFNDTLYSNISFSKPSSNKKEVMKAAKFAQLDKIIGALPQKEKTIVGERGVKLSGGEKQRVSIARAILANKKVLILDEATSALDSETEYEIQRDLKKLLEGRTSIIIAHRLSTIMNSDRIVVMKAGKIIEEGTHNSLMAKNGEYKRLWSLQKGGYIKG